MDRNEVEVQVKSLKTGEQVHFKDSEETTLQSVWDEANGKLHETRSPEDAFRCSDGTDLMDHLQKDLAQLHAEKICVNRHFEIKGPSGGADA